MILGFVEDQRVLNHEPAPALTGKQSLKKATNKPKVQKQGGTKRANPVSEPSSKPAKKKPKVIEKESEEDETPLVRQRRPRTSTGTSVEESVQKQHTVPAQSTAGIRMEETDSTSSEDEELTAQEEQQINETLASLGVPNLAIDVTPISMSFEPPPAPENAPSEPILIPSDTEEGHAETPTAPGQSSLPATVPGTDDAIESPLAEVDPDSALVIYSGLELLQRATKAVAGECNLEETDDASAADPDNSLPQETPPEVPGTLASCETNVLEPNIPEDPLPPKAAEAVANEEAEMVQGEPQEAPHVTNAPAQETVTEPPAIDPEVGRSPEQTESATVSLARTYFYRVRFNKFSV